MESQLIPFHSSLQLRPQTRSPSEPHHPWPRRTHHRNRIRTAAASQTSYSTCSFCWDHIPTLGRKPGLVKSKNGTVELVEEDDEESEEIELPKRKGTVPGAVALIVGTSIGSGILALPKKASAAGLVPSSISMIICWAFLVIEALLLVEVNVNLMRKMRRKESGEELDVISITTMAQETLGEWGGTFATLTYVFLGYTSMVAYCSKSGEILFHLINLPEPFLNFLFTLVFAALISAGGTRATDQVNQWLTTSMIGLLLAIEVLGVVLGGWSGFEGTGDWGRVPSTFPVMIFSLVYHDTTPVICTYLEGDLKRIRSCILIGSVVPLIGLLVWDAVALNLSSHYPGSVSDPVDLLLRVRWDGVPFMVEAFSLLAVGTSLIGTLLGFSEFFKEQLRSLTSKASSKWNLKQGNELSGMGNWWERKRIGLTSVMMVVAPSLLVSTTVPDAFSAATDIAGGYCMTMLYGILPPAMAWAMRRKELDDEASSSSSPALVGVGLFACWIVMEQFLQDIFSFYQ